MKIQRTIFIFLFISTVLFHSNCVMALTMTAGNSSGDLDETVQVQISVDDPTGVAGAAFTITYDTDNITLTGITSTFFDTFQNQWNDISPVPDPMPPTSVEVDGVAYDQPLIKNDLTSGAMLAAARSVPADSSNNILFTLSFELNEGAPHGIYSVGITQSIINNTDAGYDESGEYIPVLMGSDLSREAADPLAYPVLLDPTDVSIGGTLVAGSVTFGIVPGTDTDGDGIPDDGDNSGQVDNYCSNGSTTDCDDNCRYVSNPDQLDTDSDGLGNMCDGDDDNDGMPDWWEVKYSLNPLVNDAGEDPDDDGYTNLEEYIAGTNPNVSNEEFPWEMFIPAFTRPRPVINVSPASYDFGEPYIGCENVQTYTISNKGKSDLIITGFDFSTSTSDFSFDADEDTNGPLPWTLPPKEEVDVYIRFMPTDEQSKTAYLEILSNDRAQTHTVQATGAGTLYGVISDAFESNPYGAVDILFTLDRSGSMTDDNSLVVSNFETFINEMTGMDDVDYHIAVAVEDDGCVLGSDVYIDNTFSVSSAASTFETMADIYITLGSYGANTERGFSLAQAALSSSNIGTGGCNEGFYREHATLFTVHVSDEPEQSIYPYTYYVSLFQSMKDNPSDVIINAVAGDYPGGCGSATAGTGYYEAAVATGGLFLSICSTDWGEHLTQLAQKAGSSLARDSFELTELPVPETIEITVDGITTTTGWQYDPGINSVVFDNDHIPAFGSTIEIEYHLMPDCES